MELENILRKLVENISEELDVPFERLWPKDFFQIQKSPPPVGYTKESLSLMTSVELKAVCKSLDMKVSGTKIEMIARILSGDVKKKSPPRKSPPIVKETPPVLKKQIETPPVLKKQIETPPVVKITRNSFGNYEHSESGLVFDAGTKKIMGRQLANGDIVKLTPEDISICKKFKFDYILPDNLGTANDEEQSDEEDLDDQIEEEEFESEDD